MVFMSAKLNVPAMTTKAFEQRPDRVFTVTDIQALNSIQQGESRDELDKSEATEQSRSKGTRPQSRPPTGGQLQPVFFSLVYDTISDCFVPLYSGGGWRDVQIPAQPVDTLQNHVGFRLDDAFHHDLSRSVHHRDRDAFLVHVHTDIFSARHKGCPFWKG
jgi:hypothetical protein